MMRRLSFLCTALLFVFLLGGCTISFTVDEDDMHVVVFNDHNGNHLVSQRVPNGGKAIPPLAPIKEGHDFTGWSQSFDSVTEDLVIVPTFQIRKYTVTFKDDEGNVLETITVEHGGEVLHPPTPPEKEGYAFTGWSRSFKYVNQNLEIIANYKRSYLVQFFGLNDKLLKEEIVLEGGAVIPPKITPPNGYVFDGWDHDLRIFEPATIRPKFVIN